MWPGPARPETGLWAEQWASVQRPHRRVWALPQQLSAGSAGGNEVGTQPWSRPLSLPPAAEQEGSLLLTSWPGPGETEVAGAQNKPCALTGAHRGPRGWHCPGGGVGQMVLPRHVSQNTEATPSGRTDGNLSQGLGPTCLL